MEQDNDQILPEVRERAVCLALNIEGQHGSGWQAIMSVSAKTSCAPQLSNN
jgi:hypothetical protein